MPAAASTVEYLKRTGPRVTKPPEETACAYAEKATLFEWMKKAPEQRKYFDSFMTGRREEIQKPKKGPGSPSRCDQKNAILRHFEYNA